jgi:hypothetical protein
MTTELLLSFFNGAGFSVRKPRNPVGALDFNFSGTIEWKTPWFNSQEERHALLVLDNLEHLFNEIELLDTSLQQVSNAKL